VQLHLVFLIIFEVDRLSLEGYANLDQWVAGLETQLSDVLLGRLRQTIDGWCSEFARSDEDERRDLLPRDLKRKGDRPRDDKVSFFAALPSFITLKPFSEFSWGIGSQTYCSRNSDPKSSDFLGSTPRIFTTELDFAAT
jgi:hypothetical protein